MTQTLRVLAQNSPPTAIEQDLYAVSANVSTVVSTLLICNTGPTATTVSVAVAAAGGATATPDYILYQSSIGIAETITYTLGLTLQGGAVIRTSSAAGFVNFHLYGAENS